jgi:hypothetical protein
MNFTESALIERRGKNAIRQWSHSQGREAQQETKAELVINLKTAKASGAETPTLRRKFQNDLY